MLSDQAKRELHAARSSLDGSAGPRRRPVAHASARQQIERQERKKAWKRIQSESPETAELIEICRAHFGALKYVKVKIGDDTVVDTYPKGYESE